MLGSIVVREIDCTRPNAIHNAIQEQRPVFKTLCNTEYTLASCFYFY